MSQKRLWLQNHLIACLLTFGAGFIDAYTFIERGGTLVAGQTGNVVFLSVSLVHDSLEDVEVKFVTLLAFMGGIFLLTLFKNHFTLKQARSLALMLLVCVCLWAGGQSSETWNMVIVPPLSFCMGLVTTAFTEVSGRFYNNAFMTGNLKRMMMALGDFGRTRNRERLEEGVFLLFLVMSFIIGAIVSSVLTTIFVLETIWLVALLLFALFLFELVQPTS